MATLYWAANGAMPTTTLMPKQATLTGVRTLLQVATSATRPIKVVEWGVSFDGSAAATPIQCELIQTNVGITTGTNFVAYNAADVQPFDDPNAPATTITVASSGFANTGAVPGTETTSITTTRTGDVQLVAPTNQYVKQFPLGREFQVPVSKFLRVRVNAGTTVNAFAYVIWEE